MKRLGRCIALAGSALAVAALLGACQSAPQQPATPRPPDPPPVVKPQEANPKDRAVLHAELGAGYYERGQMDVALEELNEAAKLDPSNPRIYNLFGLVYAMLGDNPKDEQNFQRALSMAPQDSDIHANWGWYLCSTGKPRESLAEFEFAVRNPLYRTPEIALVNAGRCSMVLKDFPGAEAYFKRALTTAPSNVGALYGLALIAYRDGRMDEARAYIKRVPQQPAPTADVLYLGMCIEKRSGDASAELSYVTQLRNRFPDSAETKAIATGNCE